MSGSSYWPMSAVYVHGTAPFSRIHATATEVSRPPEKAIPTRSPTGRELSTLDTNEIICISLHDHARGLRRSFLHVKKPGPGSASFLLLSGCRGAGKPAGGTSCVSTTVNVAGLAPDRRSACMCSACGIPTHVL